MKVNALASATNHDLLPAGQTPTTAQYDREWSGKRFGLGQRTGNDSDSDILVGLHGDASRCQVLLVLGLLEVISKASW